MEIEMTNASGFAKPKRHRTAYTMIEVVISTLLVGIVVVGAVNTLGSSVELQVAAGDTLIGPTLADELLAEIMAQPYADPDGGTTLGPDAYEHSSGRERFDDVDDYRGWSPSEVQDREGNVLPQYEGWTREANVVRAVRSSGNSSFLLDFYNIDTGLKRITVTVISPSGIVTQRTAYRHKSGLLEQPSDGGSEPVAYVRATLTVGSTGKTASTAACLLNHAGRP